MPKVHLFVSCDMFTSRTQLEQYVDPQYDEDGDFIESAFMKETQFEEYEPMCIEKEFVETTMPVKELLEGASYYEQWLKNVESDENVNSVVAVYDPNQLETPEKSSMKYLGNFDYTT